MPHRDIVDRSVDRGVHRHRTGRPVATDSVPLRFAFHTGRASLLHSFCSLQERVALHV